MTDYSTPQEKYPRREMVFIHNPDDLKRIKFLLAGTSKDEGRPVLTHIFVDVSAQKAVSADGFRLHMCDIPECLHPFGGKLVKFITTVKRGWMIAEIENPGPHPNFGVFPEWQNVVNPVLKRTTVYRVGFTVKLIMDTLKNFPLTRRVHLDMGGPTDPYLITGDELNDCQAIVMPIHMDDKAKGFEVNHLYAKIEGLQTSLEKAQAHDLKGRLKKLSGLSPEQVASRTALYDQLSQIEKEVVKLENLAHDAQAAQKV